MLCSHDLDVSSAGVAADANGDLDLGLENREDAEAAREDEVKERPELDEIVLERGAGEDDSVVGLLEHLLAAKNIKPDMKGTCPEPFACDRNVRIRVPDLMSLIQNGVLPLLIE